MILGAKGVLESSDFDQLKPTKDKEGAFFGMIDLPSDFPQNSYIELVQMVSLAMKLAFGEEVDPKDVTLAFSKENENPRIWNFIPKAKSMEYDERRIIYAGEESALMSA